jgi:hypothetical protein
MTAPSLSLSLKLLLAEYFSGWHFPTWREWALFLAVGLTAQLYVVIRERRDRDSH